jgi:DnaJ-class molecular chaperone
VFDGKPTNCISCHQPDYDGTTTPSHAAAGYSTDCTGCHTTATWLGATFDHDASQFPLTGSHRAVACTACHADGVFDGKPTNCVSCHQPDYNATTTPPHGAAGFPLACEQCHTTGVWSEGTFDHGGTQFPLTGAHIAASCASCHSDGVYDGRPTNCLSCHQADYTGTTNPNHAAAQFPTNCGSCHTTMTWLGATFDHDAMFFPIYSGSHRQEWNTCADCHTSPTDYSVFTCTTCHTPNNTNNDHDEVPGYQYQSNACYSCHPRGRS